MRCFTILNGGVHRGIQPDVTKKAAVGLSFKDGKTEEFLPLCKEWQNFYLEGDKLRSRLGAGGALQSVPILSASIGEEEGQKGSCLIPVSLWNQRAGKMDPFLDKATQALVLVRPPRNGETTYTSAQWMETLENGRVVRDYLMLGAKSIFAPTGVEIVHGALDSSGIPTGGFLLIMDAGSSFRMVREEAEDEPSEFIFQWWCQKRPTLKRLTPANWRGQREAA